MTFLQDNLCKDSIMVRWGFLGEEIFSWNDLKQEIPELETMNLEYRFAKRKFEKSSVWENFWQRFPIRLVFGPPKGF